MSNLFLVNLSEHGSMRLRDFYTTFDELLGPRQENDDIGNKIAKNRFIRYMEALGHCEFDFDNGRVHVCARSLVRLPTTGLSKAVLIGERTQSSRKEVSKLVKHYEGVILTHLDQDRTSSVKSDRLARLLLPSCFIVQARHIKSLEQLASELGISEERIYNGLGAPVAWALADFSASIADIDKELSFEDFSDLDLPTHVFNPERLVFEVLSGQLPEKCLVRYTSPSSTQLRHIFKDGDWGAIINPYWGRYLLLAENERNILYYDECRQQLLVPHNVPLPKILARAATMCSGLVPSTREIILDIGNGQRLFDVDTYSAIPYKLAMTLAKKLAQPLQPYRLLQPDDHYSAAPKE